MGGARDQTPLVEKTDDGCVSRHRPLRVDRTYLVTGRSTQSAGPRAAQRHRLLGLVPLWLSRFEVVDTRFSRGDLTMRVRPVRPDDPPLCGRVLDDTLAPLPGTPVTVVENGAATTADRLGAFAFRTWRRTRTPCWSMRPGRPDLSKRVQYTDPSQTHDVIVPAR